MHTYVRHTYVFWDLAQIMLLFFCPNIFQNQMNQHFSNCYLVGTGYFWLICKRSWLPPCPLISGSWGFMLMLCGNHTSVCRTQRSSFVEVNVFRAKMKENRASLFHFALYIHTWFATRAVTFCFNLDFYVILSFVQLFYFFYSCLLYEFLFWELLQ